MILATNATASDRITQSNDMNNQTGGDISNTTEGSYGFSHSLGDVDINQCLGSTQWGTILVSKQKLVLNKWCAAEVYDAKGLYDMAARMRCSIPEVAEFFTVDSECIAANLVTAPPPAPVIIEDTHYDEEEEWHEEQLQMQADYDMRIAQLEEQVNRPPPPARVTREVVQQPYLSEEQKAALREVIEK
jgi:hypothetical protein